MSRRATRRLSSRLLRTPATSAASGSVSGGGEANARRTSTGPSQSAKPGTPRQWLGTGMGSQQRSSKPRSTKAASRPGSLGWACHRPLRSSTPARYPLVSEATVEGPGTRARVRSMRIGFVVNDVQTEEAVYTTVRLGLCATNRNHEAWYLGVGDLAYDPEGTANARARRAPARQYKGNDTYLRAVQGRRAVSRPHHPRRSRRAVPSQRSLHREGHPQLGPDCGHRLRSLGPASWRRGAQRSQRARQGPQQDVLPAVPRGGATSHPHHSGPQRDHQLRARPGRLTACSSRSRVRGARTSSW